MAFTQICWKERTLQSWREYKFQSNTAVAIQYFDHSVHHRDDCFNQMVIKIQYLDNAVQYKDHSLRHYDSESCIQHMLVMSVSLSSPKHAHPRLAISVITQVEVHEGRPLPEWWAGHGVCQAGWPSRTARCWDWPHDAPGDATGGTAESSPAATGSWSPVCTPTPIHHM